MKASTCLKKARKLIATTGHCKGGLARNKYRHKVDPTSKSAVKFCVLGALSNVLGVPDTIYSKNVEGIQNIQNISEHLTKTIPEHFSSRIGWWSNEDYNDNPNTTPEDIDNWLKRAIKSAKRSEGV